ncbi:MAG TPA: hypothetical protein VH639_17600 [Bryobacteraceae bacterium]|jgi:plasmid stability protein
MGDVKIRNLPDWVVARFKIEAEHKGTSLEEELRSLITEQAVQRREELIRRVKAHQDQMRKQFGELGDSTPGIRADRRRG